MTTYRRMSSPVGELLLAGDEHAITAILFEGNAPEPGWSEGTTSPLQEAAAQLAAYFAGERRAFELPLAPRGTPFQRRVWDELLRIPYGETISYGELARRVGNANASRAVGLANGQNPLPIVVPCHRVIGANGKLTGYGGGLPIKARLLELERPSLF